MPRYKLDENQQIVIDEIIEEQADGEQQVDEENQANEEQSNKEVKDQEAPMPEREEESNQSTT